MTVIERLAGVPLTIRAPVMVAALMVVISVIISERVLTRLHEMQEQQLGNVVRTYFDGLSTALIPPVLRQDVWETFDVLDRTGSVFRSVAPLETVVTGRDGRVLAASDPRKVPVLSELPPEYASSRADGGIQIDWDAHTGFGVRPLLYQQKTIGAIHASFDISHLIAERRQVLNTLLATNAALAAVFATAGYILARRMVEPITTLAAHMRSGAAGTPRTIAPEEFPSRSGEFADLFHGFNDLVEAERQRTALTQRLAEEEKLASLGRLASSMAHEINNPLGGLLNSIDTLRRHGSNDAVRDTSLSLLERGLGGIRDVVRAALATYRPDRGTQSLRLSDLEDVRLLAGPAIASRNQTLDWSSIPTDVTITSLPGPTIRQALLNLVLNASAAAGDRGSVAVRTGFEDGGSVLVVAVSDTGPGLGSAAAAVLTSQDPWSAAQAAGGLGLWMVRRMVDDVGGRVNVRGGDGSRTMITLRLPLSNRGKDVDHAA
ncbi:HAMP domain-containing sensor histidine kinase [Rhizobium sp. LC145]|uniref:sensor histidine kinase n=1 Tax=Rhizobium sp. LC145 TaxID=1120688 RepID=UPI00062A0D2C|nr:HAMP domain-containing sensor histidine kinase [Rhizobium sp. LC145]KKX29354.1 histidine kinase [Rhizobium sp. LC145]MDX3927879.1 HAMP domain-containing sensor histidine kinase [Shinella sp.]TKT68965.1 HAMP domain-containing histidine kinase [Rhizobiaceae bacterium LC148]